MKELIKEFKNRTDIIELSDIDSDGEVCISIEERSHSPFTKDAMTGFHITRDHAQQIIDHLKKEFEI